MIANARPVPGDQLSPIVSYRRTGQYFGNEFRQRLREWAILDQNNYEVILDGIVNPEGVVDRLDEDVEVEILTKRIGETYITASSDALDELLAKMGFKD